MQDDFQNLSEKQEIALVALLAGKTRKQAARSARVNEATIYRWLDDEVFVNELRKRQTRIFDETTSGLYGLTEKAIKTLERNLSCGLPSVEIKAALGIVTQATRLREMQLLDRIKRLEKIFEQEFNLEIYELSAFDKTN